jgi:hypothetical protein
MKPFADDSAVVTLKDFTIENGTSSIALHGSLDITRDKIGLDLARRLEDQIDAIVSELQSDAALPDALEAAVAPQTVKNPFKP